MNVDENRYVVASDKMVGDPDIIVFLVFRSFVSSVSVDDEVAIPSCILDQHPFFSGVNNDGVGALEGVDNLETET